MKNVILASRSPRRRELLSSFIKDFDVIPSNFDEEGMEENDPFLLVRVLALSKASTISADSEDIVIGCDTVVSLDGEIFGIPKTKEEARKALLKLSGKTHSVITGVCVLENNNIHSFECETLVTFFELSSEEIEAYISTDEPYDKAGGYGIQGKGGLLVKEISGDYQNVVGLPSSRLMRLLLQQDGVKRDSNGFLIFNEN